MKIRLALVFASFFLVSASSFAKGDCEPKWSSEGGEVYTEIRGTRATGADAESEIRNDVNRTGHHDIFGRNMTFERNQALSDTKSIEDDSRETAANARRERRCSMQVDQTQTALCATFCVRWMSYGSHP